MDFARYGFWVVKSSFIFSRLLNCSVFNIYAYMDDTTHKLMVSNDKMVFIVLQDFEHKILIYLYTRILSKSNNDKVWSLCPVTYKANNTTKLALTSSQTQITRHYLTCHFVQYQTYNLSCCILGIFILPKCSEFTIRRRYKIGIFSICIPWTLKVQTHNK